MTSAGLDQGCLGGYRIKALGSRSKAHSDAYLGFTYGCERVEIRVDRCAGHLLWDPDCDY